MSDVEHPGLEGQETTPSALPWPDTEVASRWISNLRGVIADVKAVVEDQQRPSRERRLGHLEAVRITDEGFKSIETALSYAERGLPPPPPR